MMVEAKLGSTYIREWLKEEPIANLVIIHGLGEHSGRYAHAGGYFYERGFNVYTGDLAGHGKSEGIRTYIDTVDDYLKDISLLLSRVDNAKPIFLFGHSMGGFLVLYYGIKDIDTRIKGIIASSPYIREAIKVPAWKYLTGKLMGAVYPKLRLETGLKGELVCRDKEVLAAYDTDPLNCTSITAGWYLQLEKAKKELQNNSTKLLSPCLIMQAGGDVVADPAASKELYEKLQSKDKEFVMYDGLYHELLNEPEKEMILEKMHGWILQRL